MKIYGIYDTKNSEQCLRVGTLKEVVRFLDLTAKEIGRAIKSNNLISCLLYTSPSPRMSQN